jgi:putative transposase
VWLLEVSAIPLQQSLRDLDQAFSNFFKSCQGKGKGKRVNLPRFKKRHHKQSARFTRGGFKVDAPKPLKKRLHRLRRLQRNFAYKQKGSKRRYRARQRLAKLHAKIGDIRTDFLHKLSTRLIRENQTIALEDLNVSGMVKNRKLARAISDLGWCQFRSLLEAKATKYGQQVRVIDRWEPTSQRCSCCGFRGGKLGLSVRQWQCLHCGTLHDRDINAAINIKVAGGRSETKNGCGGGRKSTHSIAGSDEASTHLEVKQLSLCAC